VIVHIAATRFSSTEVSSETNNLQWSKHVTNTQSSSTTSVKVHFAVFAKVEVCRIAESMIKTHLERGPGLNRVMVATFTFAAVHVNVGDGRAA
jgi:hypothetical protein